MQQHIIGLAGFLFLVSLSGQAAAGQLEDGIAAAERGDDVVALSLLRPLADQGDSTALEYLGIMYVGGHGVAENKAEGLKMFRWAAELGNADAMKDVGNSYEYGWAVPQDHAEAVKWYLRAVKQYHKSADEGDAHAQLGLAHMYDGALEDPAEAVKWYRKAADHSNADAQFYLGAAFEYGRGVQRNDAQAAKWYRKSAEQGIGTAQEELGDMYAHGQGVRQDYVQAHKWFNLAAASYNKAESRAKALKSRELVAHKMTPAQLAEAQRLATEWKPKLSSR